MNLVWIFVCIFFSAFLFWKGARELQNDNDTKGLVFVGFAVFVIGLIASTHLFLHDWDERFHALVAKNLMDNWRMPLLYKNPLLPYDFREWSGNHVWVHKQPLPLWLMALSMKLFGVNAMAVRMPSVVLFALSVAPMYKVARFFSNKNAAIYATLIYAVSGIIIDLVSGKVATDHYDALFLFFTLFAMWGVVIYMRSHRRYGLVIAGIFMGFAILTKWLPALIVVLVYGVMELRLNKGNFLKILQNATMLLLIAGVIAMPWQWYVRSAFPEEAAWEAAYNWKHVVEYLGGFKEPWYYFWQRITINYGELVYVPVIFRLYRLVKSVNELEQSKLMGLFVWFIVPMLFFTVVKTKMQGYILFVSPVLFVLTGEFIEMISKKKHWGYKVLLGIMIFLPILSQSLCRHLQNK